MNSGQDNSILVIGASSPIGRAVVRAANRQGWSPVATYLTSPEPVLTLEREGAAARAVELDVTDSGAVSGLFSDVRPRKMVYAAAAPVERGPLVEKTPDDLAAGVGITLTGYIWCLRAFARERMALGQPGEAAGVGSLAAKTGGYRIADYAAAKSGMIGFTRSAARELAGAQIRVNIVSPGVIEGDEPIGDAARSLPLARAGTPDEVAEAVVWLLSDQSAYVTGAELAVAGGK